MLPVYILLGVLILITIYYIYLKYLIGFENGVPKQAGTEGYYGIEGFTGSNPDDVDISYVEPRIGPYDGVRFTTEGLHGTITADHLRGNSA